MQAGSFINHLMSRTKGPAPFVGMGATILGYSDRRAATVTKVEDIRGVTYVTLTEDDWKLIAGNYLDGSAQYEFTPNTGGCEITFRSNKSNLWDSVYFNEDTGRWNKTSGGNGVSFGDRRKFYDPHF